MGSMGKKFAVIVGASALALAACSSDSDDSSDGGSGGDTVASQYDLSGVDLAIGSKDFDEQLILGQMMVQAYEAAGANVDDKVNLGGTAVAREALLSGEIDMLVDEDEVHLTAGEVVVQRGTNHAWANRGTEPCRIAFILIDAKEL